MKHIVINQVDYVVARERGGVHGIELVDSQGVVHVWKELPTNAKVYHTEKVIRPGERSVTDRFAKDPTWLDELRTIRASDIAQGIRGKRKVEKSLASGGRRAPSRKAKAPGDTLAGTRRRKGSRITSAAQAKDKAQLELTLSTLPPEVRAAILAATGKK